MHRLPCDANYAMTTRLLPALLTWQTTWHDDDKTNLQLFYLTKYDFITVQKHKVFVLKPPQIGSDQSSATDVKIRPLALKLMQNKQGLILAKTFLTT